MKARFLASSTFVAIFCILGGITVASASADEPQSVCWGCTNYGRTFSIDANAYNFGSGATQAHGKETFAEILKRGGSAASVDMTGVTNGCTVDCSAIRGTANASAFDVLTMQGGARSTGINGAPSSVSIDNFGSAGAGASISLPTWRFGPMPVH